MPVELSARRQQRQAAELRQRDELLKAAGISPERRMRLLNRAFEKLEEQMEATKSIVTKDQGVIEVVDNQARLRAIETTLDFEGVSLGKHNEQQGDRSVQVTINAPWFNAGPTISSGEGQVIEGAPTKPLITNESQ